MAALEKTVSALIDRQLPDFIRADNPQFKRFLEVYYEWLEDETKGNTVFHIMNAEKYRDVDETLDPFIRLFKQELLPYFPETSELDLVKILKGAREFYGKKGSVESVKWLFRVLFDQDIEVFYPKKQILIASDGKWKLPQAFQLTLSANNTSIDASLLEKHMGIGSTSKATCIIESSNKTIDKNFGNEILELFVSNVTRNFINGENLEIIYLDNNSVEQTFIEKIVGSIKEIKLDSNIVTDPQQKRRGLSYNVGDPIIVFGGLTDSATAEDAIAIVGNVSVGSIEGLSIIFPGYGYRPYDNTETTALSSVGDDAGANASVDIRVTATTVIDSAVDSQIKFLESINVDMLPVTFLANVLISDPDYAVFTQNNRNIVLVVENDGTEWYNREHLYANGASFATANFTARILTANTSWVGGPGTVILYNVANTQPLSTSGFLIGTNTLLSTNSSSVFNVNSITTEQLEANSSSNIEQAIIFQSIDTGGIALYNLLNGGSGFRSTPVILNQSYYDTFFSLNFAHGTDSQKLYRQPINSTGQIAHVYIDNPGSGYVNGEVIVVTGRGYDFEGNVTVNTSGSIVSTTIINRGEGYYGSKTVTVTSGTGSNGILSAYGFSEGEDLGIETGAVGRIEDVRLLSRGFAYVDAPVISFKLVDMVIVAIDVSEFLIEGERVYQGATLPTAIFQGIVKDFNRSTRTLRVFDFSGNSFGNFNAALPFTSEGGVVFTIDLTARVTAPTSYPAAVQAAKLPNPYFYGNGKARGYAEFFDGLTKFTGFYLNTDGFLSSDKKMQDGKTYHNYSYVIESEKSLTDYRNTMKDIVHPIGMIMLGKTITKSVLQESIDKNSVIYLLGAIASGSTINVQNSHTNTVTGISTEFSNTFYANVGDMLWIKDPVTPLRSQAKIIRNINSDTSLNVESNFVYVGQGKIKTQGNTQVIISGNTNAVFEFLATNDVLRMNVNNTIIDRLVSGISDNALSLNTSISTSNTGVVYLIAPDYETTNYDYDIIRITE